MSSFIGMLSVHLITVFALERSFILFIKNFLKKIIDKQNKASFKCKYCDQVYRKHATRQIEHLKKCINCPETVKQLF